MKKPKHKSLEILPDDVYKRIPVKDIVSKTLEWLAIYSPKSLCELLKTNYLSIEDIILIIEAISYTDEDLDCLYDTLFKHSKNAIPAIREAAIFSMFFFPRDETFIRFEEIIKTDDNKDIVDITSGYLDELKSISA